MELKDLAKQLCSLAGPSGFESAVYQWISDYLKPFADEIRTDPLGNLMAFHRCGKPDARIVMLDAHMDEIGFIVTGVENGFLTFDMLGGVDQRMLPARDVKVMSDPPLYGVIGVMPPHLLTAEESDKAIDPKKLYIDVGLSQEEAEKAVPPGTPAVYAGGCDELGEGLLCGKSLDDRSCAAILIKAFELLSQKELNVDLCCQISTMEELAGYRGATVGTWTVRPDIALVVDVTHGKTPDAKDVPCECGKGAAIGVGPNMNRTVTEELFRLAKERDIPCQREVCPGGNSGTNATAIQISRGGVATALISLPLKYMHTPVETVKTADMDAILRLITAYVESMEVG